MSAAAATSPEEEQVPLMLHCEKIDLTLKQCQSDALENSPALIQSLETLSDLILEMKPLAKSSDLLRSKVELLLRDVAKDLIGMNRVIASVDDEIDGVVRGGKSDDFGWYYEASGLIAQGCTKCGDGSKNKITKESENTERWIDKCLNLCGYGVSLEAAVDCLRSIVHYSSSSNNDISLKREQATFGIASTVTSLRTIRRYLLHIPPLNQEGHLHSYPTTFQLQFLNEDTRSPPSLIENLCKVCILPFEYHGKCLRGEHEEMAPEPLLSDSLTDITSLLPTLVSSACHAMNLALPWWASTKWIHTLLLQAAWKMLLIGELVGNHSLINEQHGKETSTFQTCTATYFQLLVIQMIQNGHSAMISKYFHHCWKHCGENGCDLQPRLLETSRSILSNQCQAITDSISSNRTVATFYREIIRCIAKNYAQKCTQDEELSIKCKQCMLPFLRDTIFQPLVANEDLRDVIVNIIILSPPTSFQKYTSPTGCASLSPADRAVPRCMALLLHLACTSGQKYGSESDTDSDSESCDSDAIPIVPYLSHLHIVASVWSEDVFVSRADALQQQFVTEFLLYPLQQNLVSRDEFEKGISHNGVSLATALVQGVTLRLDISLSQTIRTDGMRVAEAMASLLGHHLRFDELHPTSEERIDVKKEGANAKPKKESKTKNGREGTKSSVKVLLDPDADFVANESDLSRSESNSSTWGEEDSLEPYSLEDDEEDIRRVPRPHSLQDCFAYLVAPDSDNLAYDKQQAALLELGALVESKPFDLTDMTSTLVRVLLHLEDKYSMSMFADKKWECLVAFGISNPLDTCVQLVEEMKRNTSLGTRLEALSIFAATAERLSAFSENNLLQTSTTFKKINDAPFHTMSTRLKVALGLPEDNNKGVGGDVATLQASSSSKTTRWRQPRTVPKTTTNKFGPIAPNMICSLFAFLASTKNNSSIWGGSSGERFLSEFITTLSIMVNCASSYPSHSVPLLATDLFELAWSFHDANSVEVRRAVLLALATCMQMMPVDAVVNGSRRWLSFLNDSSIRDSDEECRSLSSVMNQTLMEMQRNQFIV